MIMNELQIASGDIDKIVEFSPTSQDLGSLDNIRRGLFYEKIRFDAINPLPSAIENFQEICCTVAATGQW